MSVIEKQIPTLLFFQNGSTFTGSLGTFRYKLKPADGIIKAEIWHGQFCYEKSEMEDSSEFEISEDGRAKMIEWLSEKTI
jgi:hypothetical protein